MLFNNLLLKTISFFLVVVSFLSCNGKTDKLEAGEKKYLFLGHIYSLDKKQRVDERVEQLDKTQYDLVLLGGDITLGSTANDTVMNYIDSVFKLKNDNVHWAAGNHDYLHPEKISQATGKPLYYTFKKNGLVFLIVDSQQDKCNIKGQQLQMIHNVLDTIQEASHLVFISHKLCWLYGHEGLGKFEWVANAPFGNDYYHTNPNNFHDELYPKLAKLEQKEIEVICIAGDIGVNAKTFSYHSPEGVDFLASGITPNKSEFDKVLTLSHKPTEKKITWKFELLDELVE